MPDLKRLDELLRERLDSAAAGECDWSELVSLLRPSIAGTASRYASRYGAVRQEDVEDIVQDTWLKISATKSGAVLRIALQSSSNTLAYIKTMALNAARDHFERSRKAPAVPLGEAEEAALNRLAGSFPEAPRNLIYDEIDRALEAGPRERTIFWLYYLQGYSSREISELPQFKLSDKGVESVCKRLAEDVRRRLGLRKGEGKKPREAFL